MKPPHEFANNLSVDVQVHQPPPVLILDDDSDFTIVTQRQFASTSQVVTGAEIISPTPGNDC